MALYIYKKFAIGQRNIFIHLKMKAFSFVLLCALIATAYGGIIHGWTGSTGNNGWNYGASNYGGGWHSGVSSGKIIKVITVSGDGWPSGRYSSGWPTSNYKYRGDYGLGWKLGGGWKPSGWSSGWQPSGWSSEGWW